MKSRRLNIFLLGFWLWQDATTNTNALLVAPSAAAKQWVTTTSPPLLSSTSSSSSSSFPPASAFVIERLSDHAPPHVFQKIAKMCINVFFNQGRGPGVYLPPWQQAQLTYLQLMQAADLQQRRYSQQQHFYSSSLYNIDQNDLASSEELLQQIWYDDTNPEISYSSLSSKQHQRQHQRHHQPPAEYNEMFVAYQVIRAEPQAAQRKPLLLDFTNVYNAPGAQQPSASSSSWQVYHDDDDVEYVRGELLGFCEVTERYFGLDHGHQLRRPMHQPQQQPSSSSTSSLCSAQVRPILTNLAVKPKARQLGIGSALVQACEDAVMERGRFHEMVLEVEAENTKALAFYQARGYHVLYQDPACRRYDVNGLLLRKVPCTRIVMRKCLYPDEENLFNNDNNDHQEEEEEARYSNRSRASSSTNRSSSRRMTSSLMSMWQRLRDKSLSYIHV